MDAAIRAFATHWFPSNDSDYRQIDEVHEARETQTRLIVFELQFAEFVELLGNALKYGPTNGANAKYNALKPHLKYQYLELRPFLLAYIRLDVEDERIGLRTLGAGTDAFEAIWVAPTLQSFLDSHDVFFRDRVARANDAIRDYTEHLHCLLETPV